MDGFLLPCSSSLFCPLPFPISRLCTCSYCRACSPGWPCSGWPLFIMLTLAPMPSLHKGLSWSSSEGAHPRLAVCFPILMGCVAFVLSTTMCIPSLHLFVHLFAVCVSLKRPAVLVSAAARAVPGLDEALSKYFRMSKWALEANGNNSSVLKHAASRQK